MLRFIGGLLVLTLILGATAIALGLVNVRQTRDAALPEIAVKKGALPRYKADVVKVEIGTRNERVEVPTVAIQKPQ